MDIPALVNDQLSGPEGRGWSILGPSKLDSNRSNTLVEAVAEVRDALVGTFTSFVEPEYLNGAPPAQLDLPTAVRFADYQAFHAGRKAEESVKATRELVNKVNALDAKLDRVLAALGGAK